MKNPRIRHIIKKQLLEVDYPPQEDGRAFQKRLSNLYWRDLLPIIERICDEISPPGQIHRIERLEIDLGQIPIDRLENEIRRQFEEQFRRQLRSGIRYKGSGVLSSNMPLSSFEGFENKEQGRIPAAKGGQPGEVNLSEMPASSIWELFSYFVDTGLLPWWAEGNDPQLLDRSLEQLILHLPLQLKQQFAIWWQNTSKRNRLVNELSDEAFISFSERFLPRAYQKAVLPALKLASKERLALAKSARQSWSTFRKIFWTEAFYYLLQSPPALVDFVEGLLKQLQGLPSPVEVAEIEALTSFIKDKKSWQERQKEEEIEFPTGEVDPSSLEYKSDQGYSRHSNISKSVADNSPEEKFASQENTPVDNQQFDIGSTQGARDSESNSAQSDKEKSSLDKDFPAGQKAKSKKEEKWVDVDLSGKNEKWPEKRSDSPRSTFNLSKEIYVNNAGLVILWPFLSRFFTERQLVNEKAFVDLIRQQRAVHLLQGIATGTDSAPEYLLPLNKLLCGLPLPEPLEAADPLTEEELEACENFLEKVIASAPILHDMSVMGFRGSFLLREGVLKAQPGQWQLNVKRETYDIVLDRFPWPFNFVKLPWMEQLLYVEWYE